MGTYIIVQRLHVLVCSGDYNLVYCRGLFERSMEKMHAMYLVPNPAHEVIINTAMAATMMMENHRVIQVLVHFLGVCRDSKV